MLAYIEVTGLQNDPAACKNNHLGRAVPLARSAMHPQSNPDLLAQKGVEA